MERSRQSQIGIQENFSPGGLNWFVSAVSQSTLGKTSSPRHQRHSRFIKRDFPGHRRFYFPTQGFRTKIKFPESRKASIANSKKSFVKNLIFEICSSTNPPDTFIPYRQRIKRTRTTPRIRNKYTVAWSANNATGPRYCTVFFQRC